MTDTVKSSLFTACRRLLRPIVRFLLRGGITSHEFTELTKTVFVEVATEDYGIQGRPTNASRVAILTGLSRREVKRIRDTLNTQTHQEPERLGSATRVLSGWHQDPEFLDDRGKPLVLPLDGDTPSFMSLLKRYAGDIPASALLKEFKKINAVVEIEKGRLKVLTRYYMTGALDPDGILRAGDVIHDLASTLHNNVVRPGRSVSRFEGRASNPAMTTRTAREFRQFVDGKGQEFLESIDDWLTEHQADGKTAGKRRLVRVGVGLYAIEEESH